MKKKGFTLVELLGVVIILGIIAVLALPPVLESINKSKGQVSDAMKQILVGASDLYMADNRYDYERYNGNRYCITLRELVSADKLTSPVVDPTTKQALSLDKYVQIEIDDNAYKYEIVDSCQEHLTVGSLVRALKTQYSPSNTVGLLKDDTGYYYKGSNNEVSNNFIWFGGHLWRVIAIDNDNNLTMITQQPLTNIQPASSVWTTKEQYEASYINHWLNDITDGVFLKSMEEIDRHKIINTTFNVGIYTNVKEFTTTQKVGLLDETQYTKAGGADSFLDIKDNFWLGNRNQSQAMLSNIDVSGNLVQSDIALAFGIRPVIKISNLTFTGGKGTLDDPYRENSTTTSTSDIKVGEYISIPTTGADCGTDKRCLFRVVSKDNNSIKVTLNGLLASTSAFGSTVTYTSGNTIDIKVKAFAETIDNQYSYSGTDKTFGIGTYLLVSETGQDYKIVQTPTYTGNVGLPVIGEMFTANDIDITTGSTAKTFVNVATIENPTLSSDFWTMNAYNTSVVRSVNNHGNLNLKNLSSACGVRPVLFLKNSLTFTGGEGTAEHPFTVE